MRNISVILNNTKIKAFTVFEKLFDILEKYNVNIEINNIKENTDIIFTLGGDGTLVRAIKENKSNIPIVGINCGTLGFLTEINEENLEKSIKKIFEGEYFLNSCNMLHCEVIRDDRKIFSSNAINDVVISRSSALEMIRFDVYINNQRIKQYNADGFIVSTPLGSSAYALSCGGPIIEPTSKLIELTPIASHSLINRSIVIDDTKEVELKIVESRNNKSNTLLSIDGEKPFELEINDKIIITKASQRPNLVRLNNDSFVDNIAKKMFES